eukprot:TRINITY_DN42849_c0_g1_i1.p1 TRINITY_DN42849_c0_g1~~TRINITY_DN42849_c0_g1_i1.p1  ORF type:complete len:235 (-),score=43.59 TRINITY_DN42849_c0_g1_i1:28-732(-)
MSTEVVSLQDGFGELECPPTPKSESIRQSISVAMVCHSNVNRSMEAHDLAFRHGFQVSSYGAGSRVRLPGMTQDDPKVFEFGTPYHEMFKRLYEENFHFYSKNGMLQMLDRDRKVKFFPQRWQDETKRFDVVICFEQRVYELVIDDLQKRQFDDILENMSSILTHRPRRKRSTHVVNIETVDNHRAAKVGSQYAVKFVELLYEKEENWEDNLSAVLDTMEEITGAQVLHTLIMY